MGLGLGLGLGRRMETVMRIMDATRMRRWVEDEEPGSALGDYSPSLE